ncbi:hypothetical protein BKA66DRAFT_437583 [Pyrenochaeta sp. MPI-SDFR-AT-0127]|nr:hypothetical protein BKA66DRAFT_437583 [Pyrenochaeta sp. MPI-SDFR-AT-0127]
MESQSPLLRLPRELRDQIIEYVFEEIKQDRLTFDCPDTSHHQATNARLENLPGICRASGQLYYEVTPYFLSRITPALYDIETTCWLRKWLATLPSGSGFRAIRELAFRNFHGPEQIKGYELISLCPNLCQLNIMFGDEYSDPGIVPSLAIRSLSSAYNAYESLDNIVLMHQLHKLVDIPKLERLYFGFHDWEQPVSMDRARQVTEWLGVKFRAQGRIVRIECQQILYGNPGDDYFDNMPLRFRK